MTEILPGLFVGDMVDALSGFDGLIICMLEEKPADEPPNATWIPFLREGPRCLDIAASIIENALGGGRQVLVHCGAGSERAPLTVAWFLHTHREMTMDEAYDLLISKRPVVQDRRSWIGLPSR